MDKSSPHQKAIKKTFLVLCVTLTHPLKKSGESAGTFGGDFMSTHQLVEPPPVHEESVVQELIVQEFVGGEDGGDGDQEVHELAAEEPKRVAVELVVHVFLEVAKHPAHLLLGVVHHAASGA